jgi:hypothetical protein
MLRGLILLYEVEYHRHGAFNIHRREVVSALICVLNNRNCYILVHEVERMVNYQVVAVFDVMALVVAN